MIKKTIKRLFGLLESTKFHEKLTSELCVLPFLVFLYLFDLHVIQ